MTRIRALSRQAHSLLSALAEPGQEWRHGYDLALATGLRSGTLYPLLIRLEGQGLLEAEWQPPTAPGRPPRHAYRLTAAGMALAHNAQASAQAAGVRSGPAGGTVFS